MRVFARDTSAGRQSAAAKQTLRGRLPCGQTREGNYERSGAKAAASSAAGGAFSRVPIFARQACENRWAPRASGELEGGAPSDGQEWRSITGDGGSPASPRASGGSASPPAAPTMPKLKKTTVNPLATSSNGAFSWGVQWSIDNASASTNGWIVQHVVVRQDVAAWHPPLLHGATMPIVTGQGAYGGLRTSWYPLWEAWQVRGGAVFVGGSTSPHSADTYGQGAVGADTKGKTEVAGRADFYQNLALPAAFTVRNAAPAWALPATNTNPALAGGTGALHHDLTATWDGVAGTGATTATTV